MFNFLHGKLRKFFSHVGEVNEAQSDNRYWCAKEGESCGFNQLMIITLDCCEGLKCFIGSCHRPKPNWGKTT